MDIGRYTIIWGRDPDELIHENTYSSEKVSWSVYKQLSFTDYAALLCDGAVIADNLGRGPVINIEERE